VASLLKSIDVKCFILFKSISWKIIFMALPKCMEGNMSLPLIGSPMFIISGPELVIAQCKAGITGAFPSLNARPIEQLDQWLSQITQELAAYKKANPGRQVAPFAVNSLRRQGSHAKDHDGRACARPSAKQ